MQTRTAAAALGVALAAVPASHAAAQTPPPTLAFDRACYTEHMPAVFTGTGYTPGGDVDLLFSSPMRIRGSYATRAGADGSLNGSATFPDEDDFLDDSESRETVFVSANDRARTEAGAPPESQFATASLTYTRWMGFSPGRYVPGKRAPVEISGWAFATGQTAWMQFRKGARTVRSVKIGRLGGDCGDRKARVTVPRSLAPGRYRVVFSLERRGLSESYTWRSARVVGKGAASAAAARPMARARAAS